MTPTKNYERFKQLFNKYGDRLNKVKQGTYSIYQVNDDIYEVEFLNSAENGDYFHDPVMRVANSIVQLVRSPQTKRELDERLHNFLIQFEIRVST